MAVGEFLEGVEQKALVRVVSVHLWELGHGLILVGHEQLSCALAR